MNQSQKQRALNTLSDPNATEDQWLKALEELKTPPLRLPFWFTQRRTINLYELSKSWVGFAGALAILVFQIFFLSFVFPQHIQDLLPLSLAIMFGIVRGLTEHKQSSEWHGLSWGLALCAIFFSSHILYPVAPCQSEVLHHLIAPGTIFSYFAARRYASHRDRCERQTGEPCTLVDAKCDAAASLSDQTQSRKPQFVSTEDSRKKYFNDSSLSLLGLASGGLTVFMAVTTLLLQNARPCFFIVSACILSTLLALTCHTKRKAFSIGFNFGLLSAVMGLPFFTFTSLYAGKTFVVAAISAFICYAGWTSFVTLFSTRLKPFQENVLEKQQSTTPPPLPKIEPPKGQNEFEPSIVLPLHSRNAPYLVAVDKLKARPRVGAEKMECIKWKQSTESEGSCEEEQS
ncbi:MAG: hypothetical protein K2X77_07860 [Candidatus Obscuribacterales bacterium]|jgi:hypothetical protein|nr:hypothetical protein [Candidatus Obscuribacterales bacterium]